MKVVYIGERFYTESGSIMSSIYTEDGARTDWGFVNLALANGDEVHIRQASEVEIDFYESRLFELKNKKRV